MEDTNISFVNINKATAVYFYGNSGLPKIIHLTAGALDHQQQGGWVTQFWDWNQKWGEQMLSFYAVRIYSLLYHPECCHFADWSAKISRTVAESVPLVSTKRRREAGKACLRSHKTCFGNCSEWLKGVHTAAFRVWAIMLPTTQRAARNSCSWLPIKSSDWVYRNRPHRWRPQLGLLHTRQGEALWIRFT